MRLPSFKISFYLPKGYTRRQMENTWRGTLVPSAPGGWGTVPPLLSHRQTPPLPLPCGEGIALSFRAFGPPSSVKRTEDKRFSRVRKYLFLEYTGVGVYFVKRSRTTAIAVSFTYYTIIIYFFQILDNESQFSLFGINIVIFTQCLIPSIEICIKFYDI